jgi:hypothetical protein
MERIIILVQRNKIEAVMLGVIICLICLGLTQLITSDDSKLRVIVPYNYNGNIIIGFSNSGKKHELLTKYLDSNGIVKVDGDFSDFNKEKNIDYYMTTNNKHIKLKNYLFKTKKADTNQIYFLPCYATGIGDHYYYIVIRIGVPNFLSRGFKFGTDDEIIFDRIHSISW